MRDFLLEGGVWSLVGGGCLLCVPAKQPWEMWEDVLPGVMGAIS